MKGTASIMGKFQCPKAKKKTTIAVISDPHIPRQSVETMKLTMPESFLERAITDINDREVAGTVFLGDITMDGYESEFDRFDKIVSELNNPWIAIPGNHDVPKQYDEHESPGRSEFVRRYTQGDLPFLNRYGDVTLIGLDSAFASEVRNSHDGLVGTDQLDWLDDKLSRVENPIVALHHILPPTLAQFDECRDAVAPDINRPPTLRDAESLVDVLTTHSVPLVLTGHLHIPSIGTTGSVRELNTPSTGTYPPAYLLLEVGPEGTAVRYIPLGDASETRVAFTQRSNYRAKANLFATMAASRVASFPLVEE